MAGWPVVHPGFAVAAAGAAFLPVLIHLINRRRYKVIRWGAMSFLRGAVRRSARRIRVEQWALLLVRMAVIGVLFLAAARPYFPMSALGVLGAAPMHRIMVIDDSCSMGAAAAAPGGEGDRFSRAVDLAEGLMGTFGKGDAVSLVTLAFPARAVVGYAAYDRRRVRDALRRLRVTQRGTDLGGGFAAVSKILDDSEPAAAGGGVRRMVYVISDLARTGWSAEALASARALAGRLGREEGRLVLVPVGEGEAANLAVTEVHVDRGHLGSAVETGVGGGTPLGSPLSRGEGVGGGPVGGVGRTVRVAATVGNFSARGVAEVSLQVRVGDRIVRRVRVDRIGAYQTRTARFSVAVGETGARGIAVSIAGRGGGGGGDALAADDSRWASVEVRQEIGVLLVEGRGGKGLEGDAGYLATALAPAAGGSGAREVSATGIRVRRIPAREVAIELGSGVVAEGGDREGVDYGMVALCNVARLDEADWGLLAGFVRSGGGLLVLGGGLVQAEHYSRYGFAGGEGVLPCPVVGVTDALGAGAGSPGAGAAGGAGVGFAAERFTHPVLAEFSDQAESGLFLARVRRYLQVGPPAGGAEVLLRYGNGDAALVGGVRGRGRVMLMTTSGDMSWTNLPAKGDYVSLMANITSYLARLKGTQRTLQVGESIAERLSANQSTLPLRVTTPGGRVDAGRLTPGAAGFVLAYGPLERPGPFRVAIGSREVVYAVNIDAAESDLRAMDEAALRRALKCDFTYAEGLNAPALSAARAQTNEIGGALLYAVLGLIVVESWLATRFGVHR